MPSYLAEVVDPALRAERKSGAPGAGSRGTDVAPLDASSEPTVDASSTTTAGASTGGATDTAATPGLTTAVSPSAVLTGTPLGRLAAAAVTRDSPGPLTTRAPGIRRCPTGSNSWPLANTTNRISGNRPATSAGASTTKPLCSPPVNRTISRPPPRTQPV